MACGCLKLESRPTPVSPGARIVTSQLSRLECRTKPLRDGDHALLVRYDSLFGASRVAVRNLTTSVVDGATQLRAKYGFKSPDALHLASAVDCRAAAFWTGTRPWPGAWKSPSW
jgi:uncharacterized protein